MQLWRQIMNVTERGAHTPDPPALVPETESFAAFERFMREDGIEWEALPEDEVRALVPGSALEGRVYKIPGWEHGQDRYEIVWIEER